MSLMNDALRKKNREKTGSPAVTGFSDTSQRPRTTKKWFTVLAAMILLTTAAFAGIHLMQSTPGNALLVKSPLPTRSRPPVSHAPDTTSTVERQTDVTPIQTSAGGNLETKRPGDASTMEPANEKPVPQAVSNASPSIEMPVEPSQRDTGAVSRAFEPGPDLTVRQRQKTPSAASRQPRSPTHLAPSSPPREPIEIIGERKAGAAVRKTAQSDQDGDLFYKKALTYHRSSRLTDAVRLYRQVLKSNSSHPGAMLNLAAAYMKQGNYFDAQPLLKRLEQSTPRPEGVLLNLAIAAIGMADPEKALDYLDRAKSVSDASPWEICFHRAVAFARMNRFPEALALYRKAETVRPDDPRLQFNLAVTCDTLGMYPEALAHYEAVLRASSKPSETDAETITQRIRTIGRYLGTAQSPAKG